MPLEGYAIVLEGPSRLPALLFVDSQQFVLNLAWCYMLLYDRGLHGAKIMSDVIFPMSDVV